MKREFTASVYIIDAFQVLLIFHRKLGVWLPPGGHLEPNELPSEAAIREAKEETGLDIQLIRQENLWVDSAWNSSSFERPYLCLLENIPARAGEPAHQHIDFVYVAFPLSDDIVWNETETNAIRWFTWEEVDQLALDHEIFYDTKKAIKQIFSDFPDTARRPLPSLQGSSLK